MPKACGNEECSVSSGIHNDEGLTFGSGLLNYYGYWEFPCVICANAWKEKFPETDVWPSDKKE